MTSHTQLVTMLVPKHGSHDDVGALYLKHTLGSLNLPALPESVLLVMRPAIRFSSAAMEPCESRCSFLEV